MLTDRRVISLNAAISHPDRPVPIRRSLGIVRDHQDSLAQPLIQIAQ
jgi:hypothetical protein